MDSSRFHRGYLGHKGVEKTSFGESWAQSVEKTSFDNIFSKSSRRRSNLLPAIQTSIFQEQTNLLARHMRLGQDSNNVGWFMILSVTHGDPHLVDINNLFHLHLTIHIEPKSGGIALWPNTRFVKCNYCVSQNRNEANDKVQCYSILLTSTMKFRTTIE